MVGLMDRAISVLVVEDHTLVREALVTRLTREKAYHVVGAAPRC